jgi:pimeloyl-ACP methyl ester carboxylesterase
MPSPISSPHDRNIRRRREADAAEGVNGTAAAKPAEAKPVETPQADWTRTLADPAQRAAARTRHAGVVPNQGAEAIRTQNERAEMDAIGGKNGPGRLMNQGGNPRVGTTVTVHGINDNPASVTPLGDKTKKTGEALQTFAWDDRSRRLGDSANDFAKEVKGVLDANPNAPVTINAYSMGGRVAAVGMARLEQTGALKGRDVTLNLIATPLQGFGSANMAGMGAAFAPSLRSSQDMGTRSAFQRELAGARFNDVKVKVFGGGADEVAKPDARWTQIARNLAGGAEPTILPGATHDSSIAAAAARLR